MIARAYRFCVATDFLLLLCVPEQKLATKLGWLVEALLDCVAWVNVDSGDSYVTSGHAILRCADHSYSSAFRAPWRLVSASSELV